ncbi:MAG: hypothetical protein CMJ64_12925 [Planctomycetaceae bacterium]|nr:hypothetical protein [Planctomycetaceae bacterium]
MLTLLLCLAGQFDTAAEVKIGMQKQLLVDDHVVADRTDVERRLGIATKANGGEPIFPNGRFYGTVLHDAGKFKMWHRKADNTGYAYAESFDGLHFEPKGELTGINFAGDINLAVEWNRPTGDSGFRFIGGYDAPGMAAGIAVSTDGLRWKPLNDGKPVTFRAADCHNQVLWDPLAKTYRLFTRTDFGSGGGPLANTVAKNFEVRGTRGMTNPDIYADAAKWNIVRQWVFDREGPREYLRRQIYSMTVWIHEGVYFGLLSVYEHPADVREGLTTDKVKRHERDVMSFYIATSRDADQWDLTWVYAGQPIVPRGPEQAFDKDIVFPSSTIVTHDDKHWLYYHGSNERHGTAELKPAVWFEKDEAIGLATLPLDRFVSLHAGDVQGTLVTKPFRLAGEALQVNVDAKDGELAVDVLDARGKPIVGYSGKQSQTSKGVDDLRLSPRWQQHADLSALIGKTVRLRFRMRNADIYAFQVTARK